MKKSFNIGLVLMTSICLFAMSAQAARTGNKNYRQKDSITSTQSAETRYSSAYPQIGLGISSLDIVTRTTYPVSALIMLNNKMTLHTLFGISSTSPFQFGLGGILKFNVVGTPYAGLHIGGGLGLGTLSTGATNANGGAETDLFFNILGNIGVHFQFPSLNNVAISFDAGPAVRIFNDNTDFVVRGLGDILGLSVHFMLD